MKLNLMIFEFNVDRFYVQLGDYFIMIHIRDPDRPERCADIGDGPGPVTWKRRS